ncbi:hypothetical protein ACSSS7_003743 [Eimeria intestinalis]
MARSGAADLSVRPPRLHARGFCCSARSLSMQRLVPPLHVKDRKVWGAALFLAVVAASLLPSAATAQCASRKKCTESSAGDNCSGDHGLAKTDGSSSTHGDRRNGQDCLEEDVAFGSVDSAKATATGLVSFEKQEGGTLPVSHTEASAVSVVRLYYAPEDERQPIGKGTLIDGRYLLIDLLHPPRRNRPQARVTRAADFIDSSDLALQLRSSSPSAHSAADRGSCEDGDRDHWTTQSSSTGLWQWLKDSPSSSSVSGAFPLLLPPAGETALTARAGAAFAAAVVSAHSELVLAKQRGQLLEGFCVDPFIAFDRDADSTERPEEQQQRQEQEARVQRGFAREVFFGLWLRGLPHIARFLEVLPADPHGLAETLYERAASPPATTEGVESAAAAAAAAAARFLPEMSIDELATAARSATQGCRGEWLVFANEGISLTHLFFVADPGGSGLLEPSALWWHLKASARFHRPPRRMRHLAAAAAASAAASADAPFRPLLLKLHEKPTELLLFLRSLLQQLLQALHAAHKRHVTHRDVKLENVLVHSSLPPDARLADWGSAVSNDERSPVAQALKALLGEESPSLLEETDGYQPPEVWAEAAGVEGQDKQEECQHQASDASASTGTCNSQDSSKAKQNNTKSLHRRPSYDIWGVGLIFLKLALGTPTPLEPLEGRGRTRVRRAGHLLHSCSHPFSALLLVAAAAKQETTVASATVLLQRARGTPEKSHAVRRRNMLITTLGDLCLIPWSSDRLPARATTTAVAAGPPHTFFSSLKSAVVSVTDGFYHSWRAIFFGEPEEIASANKTKQEHHGLVAHDVPARARNALWQILRARDAAGVGVPNPLARDLLRKLLAYDPQERLTAEAALQHPWFAVAPEAAGAVNEPTNKEF